MKTNSLYLLAVAGGAVLFVLATPQPLSGQNALQPAPAVSRGAAPEPSPQMAALLRELTEQNKQLVANQAAMEARIDEITESVRQARLFTARARGMGAK